MDVHLPKIPKKKKHNISVVQVAARWRTRTAHARWLLEQAGVPIFPVELDPVPGISMNDLLRVEKQMREAKSQPLEVLAK